MAATLLSPPSITSSRSSRCSSQVSSQRRLASTAASIP
jgi:hypothetical protein